MKFIVITSASAPNKLMDKYVAQLIAAGIPHQVYPIAITSPSDGTVELTVTNCRRLASIHIDCDRLILTDAWDVLCYATREQIECALSSLPESVTFAAERNCYPDPSIAAQISDRGTWRYVNGGMLTASPRELIKWCDAVERHPKYAPTMIGQQWFNCLLAERDPIIQIDWETRLFYCMYLENGELAVGDGRPCNTVHNTYPSFIHFNGSWPWDKFLAMMEHP